MNDVMVAKIIMAINELGSARTLLTAALKEGGDEAVKIVAVLDKIKVCETDLQNIQAGK
ncbi:MAG TPA: hypothetical protein VF531_15400 [Bacillota bacterium]